MLVSPFNGLTTPEPITALQWAGENRLVVAGPKVMGLYDLNGQLLSSIEDGAGNLAWRPDTNTIRYLRQHNQPTACATPRDWDWETGTIREVDQGVYCANCGLFDHQGNYVHGGELYEVGYWKSIDAAGKKISSTDKLPIVMDMAFSPDGTKLLTGCKRLQLSIWQYPHHSGSPEKVYGTQTGILSVAWSDSGRYIAAGQLTGHLVVFDTALDESVAKIVVVPDWKAPAHTMILKIRFVPGAEHLILASTRDFTQLINWKENQVINTATAYGYFAVSPSGEQLALGSNEGMVTFCDVQLNHFV